MHVHLRGDARITQGLHDGEGVLGKCGICERNVDEGTTLGRKIDAELLEYEQDALEANGKAEARKSLPEISPMSLS